jgi:hypothetical protein
MLGDMATYVRLGLEALSAGILEWSSEAGATLLRELRDVSGRTRSSYSRA